MKITVHEVKQTPKGKSEDFSVGVYGAVPDNVEQWINHHKLKTTAVGPYTNICIDKPISELFAPIYPHFDYMDGFSPNLNKHLHLGHASNLVLAKAFKAMGMADQTIAILGDTLSGEVTKEEAMESFQAYCKKFDYPISKIFYASQMKLQDMDCPNFENGTGDYEGTKVFDIDGQKIVGIKSDGSTTYFYQDVALAQELGAFSSTLYLTGTEQIPHFETLKKLYPHTVHVGLGLVKANGGKMSSSLGNVIFFEDVIGLLKEKFENDHLVYNVLAGYILKSLPKSEKKIDLEAISNPLNSSGLYLSYTLAKLKSAGALPSPIEEFASLELQFAELKAKSLLQPNALFSALVQHSEKISKLYESHPIKGNSENTQIFSALASDLLHGMKKLGLFDIEKV